MQHTLIDTINIGELLLKFFWGAIELFKGIYNLFATEITLPNWLINAVAEITGYTLPTISVFGLFTASGAIVLLALSIYYIVKSPI